MPRQRCGIQMECTNQCLCPQKDDLINDPAIKTWMRTTSPSFFPLSSNARAEGVRQLASQISSLDPLFLKLDHAREQVEVDFKEVEKILLQIKDVCLEVTKQQASLAPIRCIPIEILGYILASMDPPSLPDDAGYVVGLSSVSKIWNRASTLAPDLWTNFNIDSRRHLVENSTLANHQSMSPACIERCLLNANTRPLAICLTSSNTPAQLSSAAFENMYRSLPRWRSFQYECRITVNIELLCYCFRWQQGLNHGSSLEELEWTPCRHHWAGGSGSMGHKIQPIRLNNLQRLSLHGHTVLLRYFRTPVLTDLSIYDLSLTTKDFSIMAQSMPHLLVLRCLNCWYDGYQDMDPPASPSIQFQNMRDFYLILPSYSYNTREFLREVLMRSNTLLNIYHTINEWGPRREAVIPAQGLWPNISFVELTLNVWDQGPVWDQGLPGSEFDWTWPVSFYHSLVLMPNVESMSLRWILKTEANNNRFAEILLSRLTSNHEACPHLKHLNCYGVPWNEKLIGKDCHGTFLLTLEAFAESRSRIREEVDQHSKAELCLISIAWERNHASSQPPDLVDATWEVLSALMDDMVEEELSDDIETEESECSWNGDDSSESELDISDGKSGDEDDVSEDDVR